MIIIMLCNYLPLLFELSVPPTLSNYHFIHLCLTVSSSAI